MNVKGTELPDFPPPHPGALISRVLLRNYRMTESELASRTGIEPLALHRIIEQKDSVTERVASMLSEVFGKAARRLVAMQRIYDFYASTGRKPSQSERRKLLANEL